MVVGGAEEGLIDGSADECFGGSFVAVEHVVEGVLLAFKPELIVELNIVIKAQHGRLARADDDAGVDGGVA
jgi:hypothetical protein